MKKNVPWKPTLLFISIITISIFSPATYFSHFKIPETALASSSSELEHENEDSGHDSLKYGQKYGQTEHEGVSNHGEDGEDKDEHEYKENKHDEHKDGHEHEGGHEERLYLQLNPETGVFSPLPWWIILIPFVGAITLFWIHNSYLQGLMVIFTSCLTFITSLLMYPLVIHGQKFGEVLRQGIYYSLPFLPSFQLNLTFKVDPAALTLVIFTGLVWLLVAIFSHDYLSIENHRLRYNVANLCCLSATLGAFMAGDLFTLYIFYECILLFLYLMVIHREDAEALRAAKVYLYFGVFTGLLLLFGIFLFSYFAGSIDIGSAASRLETLRPELKYLVAALFLIGFGGKAGVFLEHIWMPSSYGSAPCLTAALSSGIMIEVGAYGIFRTVNMIFAPSGLAENSANWITTSQLGYILIWVGIITMFFGAINALFSTHALRLLAYSSVSQMGYIIMGIGCAAYMGSDGAMGLAGALYHIINHALFKAGLFLSIGAVYFCTRELDIRKLGGLWKELPIAAITFLICALAIAGFPCFNGFASKTMLHHAIIEAYQHSVHLSPVHKPDSWLCLAEIIFIITAGGTFAYNMKLFGMTFLGPKNKDSGPISPTPLFMKVSLIFFSIGILFMGLFPNWLLEKFIGPMLSYFAFDPKSHAYHIIYNLHAASQHSILPLLYDPIKKTILSSTEVVHNLSGGSTAILVGGTILLIGLGFRWFEKRLSSRFSLDIYYRKILEGFRSLCRLTYHWIVGIAERIVSVLMVYLWIPNIKLDLIIPEPPFVSCENDIVAFGTFGDKSNRYSSTRENGMCKVVSHIDERYTGALDNIIHHKRGVFDHISRVAQGYDMTVGKTVQVKGIFGRISQAEEKMASSFDKALTGPGKLKILGNFVRADHQWDEAFEKLIFSRFLWGVFGGVTKSGTSKNGFWKYFNSFEERYDGKFERLLFGIIGSEDLSKIKLESSDFSNSWFLSACKKASEIHTGDIGSYISWIAISLTMIISLLVGFLYIKSFFAMIIAFTIVLISSTILVLLLKR